MAIPFVTHFQRIVRHGSHGPVVGTEDALVVVAEVLPADTCKKAVLCLQVYPRLVDVQAVGLVASPRATVLDRQAGGKSFALVAHAQQRPLNDERCLVVIFLFIGQSSFAQFAARQHVQVDGETIFFHFLCVAAVGLDRGNRRYGL